MAMRLDSALKLYIGLYVVCFCMTWFISVPMLVHVVPNSECLLFVTPYVKYGSPVTCHLVGFIPVGVAIAAMVLIVLHAIQLRALYKFLRKRTPHTSDYHQRPTRIFWRIVIFHGVVTAIVLVVASMLTAGYVTTCQNLHREVSIAVRTRVKADLWGGGTRTNEHYDRFANDQSIDRYTNINRDVWGQSSFERSITCRNILTDPEIHSQLKQNHANNPYYKQFFGHWWAEDNYSDVGDIRFHATRNNMILEMCMAGAWISFALWLIIFILMVKERHHIKARLTDGSVYSRSASRMSNQSFDKMSASRYSNYSGSQMSKRTASSGGRRGMANANGSYSSYPRNDLNILPDDSTMQNPGPLATSNPIQKGLMDYFALNPPTEDEVDVDAALANPDPIQGPVDDYNDTTNLDQSFELPIVDDGLGGPPPLGDEVSSGRLSEEIPHQWDMQPQVDMMPNPNRVVGRRGPSRPHQPYFDVSPISNQPVQGHGDEPVVFTTEFNMISREYEKHEYTHPTPKTGTEVSYTQPDFSRNPPPQKPISKSNSGSYKTHLGTQSMI